MRCLVQKNNHFLNIWTHSHMFCFNEKHLRFILNGMNKHWKVTPTNIFHEPIRIRIKKFARNFSSGVELDYVTTQSDYSLSVDFKTIPVIDVSRIALTSSRPTAGDYQQVAASLAQALVGFIDTFSFSLSSTSYILEWTRVSTLGVPGVPWNTQILADQLTMFQTGGTDYAQLITTGTSGFSDLPTALLKCKWTRKWKGKSVDETFSSPLGASPTWPIMGFVKTPSTLASNNQRTSSNSLNKSKTNSSKLAEYNVMCKWPT